MGYGEQSSDDDSPNPRKILLFLIERFGSELSVSEATLAARIQATIGEGEHAIVKILKGQTASFRRPTASKLVRYFAEKGILLKEDWFGRHTVEEFKAFVDAQADSDEGIFRTRETTLHLPYFGNSQAGKREKDTIQQLSDKRFYSYRYAFEDGGKIARELVYFSVLDDRLLFSYYFRVGDQVGEEATHLGQKSYRVCKGEAITVGESVFCAGIYHNEESGSTRMRAMVIHREDTGGKNKYRHAILLSETPSTHISPNNPVAGKVVLERIDDKQGPVLGAPNERQIADAVEWLNDETLGAQHPKGTKIRELISNDCTQDHRNESKRSHILWQNAPIADGKLRE